MFAILISLGVLALRFSEKRDSENRRLEMVRRGKRKERDGAESVVEEGKVDD
jgi:hypothetical protein